MSSMGQNGDAVQGEFPPGPGKNGRGAGPADPGAVAPVDPRVAPAVAYAKQGLLVLPLHSWTPAGCSCGDKHCEYPGAHPIDRAWPKKLKMGEVGVRGLLQKWPEANLGIATGRSANVFVLAGIGDAGRAGLAELVAQYGPFPDAARLHYGKDDVAYLCASPPGHQIPTSRNHLGTGVDVYGENRWFVAPPSCLPTGVVSWAAGYGAFVRADVQPGLIEWASRQAWNPGASRKSSVRQEGENPGCGSYKADSATSAQKGDDRIGMGSNAPQAPASAFIGPLPAEANSHASDSRQPASKDDDAPRSGGKGPVAPPCGVTGAQAAQDTSPPPDIPPSRCGRFNLPGRLASSLVERQMEYFLPPWFFRGIFHLLVGKPGTGKSSILAHLTPPSSLGGWGTAGLPVGCQGLRAVPILGR